MAYGFFKIIKGLVIREEGTLTPKEIDIVPGGSASTKTTITSSQTSDQTLTLPDATDTLVGKATTDTLQNKTLTAPVINNPTGITKSDVGLGNVDNTSDATKNAAAVSLTNHTIDADLNTIINIENADIKAGAAIDASKIADGSVSSTEFQYLSGVTSDIQTQINNKQDASTAVTLTGTQTLQNKTLDNTNTLNIKDTLFTLEDNSDGTKKVQFELSSVTTGTTAVLTMPSASGTLVTVSSLDSFSNKELKDNSVSFVDETDANKKLNFSLGGATTSTTTTIVSSQTANRNITLPDATDTLVGKNTTDTLTNKILTSPTINTPTIDVATLDGQASTPANPSSGFYKAYVKDSTGKLTILNSAGTETTVGSGSSAINYITNSDAEVDTAGWIEFTNSGNTRPTGSFTGSNADFALTRTTSSPLRGTGSFLITKNAAVTAQGAALYYDFTIDSADQAKVLQVSFDYKLVSGTFQVGTSSQDSDMIVYLYDVTNSVNIEPSSFKLDCGVVGVNLKYQATFQTASNSTSYKLILFKATSTSSAFSMMYDNVLIGPQVVSKGAAISDWVSYTPTFANLGSGSVTSATGRYRQVGDSYEIQIEAAKDATAGTGAATVTATLPTGAVVDSTKLDFTSTGSSNVGTFLQAATALTGVTLVASSTTVSFYIPAGNFQGSNWSANAQISASFTVPIVGKSSNSIMSSDTDTRIVDLVLIGNPNNTITGTTSKMTWAASPVSKDSHGGWDQTNSRYVVPVSGDYFIAMQTEMSGTEANDNHIGLQVFNFTTSTNLANFYSRVQNTTLSTSLANGSILLTNLKAGDNLEFRSLSTITTPAYANTLVGTNISLMRLSGPSVITASETVAARYTSNAGQLIEAAGGGEVINFEDKDYDTHNAVTTGAAWVFTAPISGIYSYATSFQFADAAWTVGDVCALYVRKNGVATAESYFEAQASVTMIVGLNIAHDVYLNAGDTLDVFVDVGGTNKTFTTNSRSIQFTVRRVG